MSRRTHTRPPVKLALFLLPLLVLALAGCDVEGIASPQSGVSTTPSVVLSPTVQLEPTATQVVESPTPVSVGTLPAGSASPGEGGAPRTYKVQPGDTLSQIAEQFDVSLDVLMAANSISGGDFLQIGQVLTIPPARSTAGTAGGQQEPTQVAVAPTTTSETVSAQAPTATQAAVAVAPTSTPEPPAATGRQPVVVNGRSYDAYNEAAIKKGQWYQYTCEFDAAWIVLKTYGFDVSLEDMIAAVGLDESIEPYYKETKDGIVVYGGDITTTYSGNYRKNFLARSTGSAMRKAFEAYDLTVTPVQDRESLEAALLRGELVWIKTTVDFKPWVPVTWVMPDGRTARGVLGNDHALVVMGFNKDGVLIRDPLGPTSTGRNRPYGYEVPWKKFMAAWGAQEYDGLAVAPPGR